MIIQLCNGCTPESRNEIRRDWDLKLLAEIDINFTETVEGNRSVYFNWRTARGAN